MFELTKTQMKREIMQVSSGTFACLTGLVEYEKLEAIEAELLIFVENSKVCYKNWMQAWNHFCSERNQGVV